MSADRRLRRPPARRLAPGPAPRALAPALLALVAAATLLVGVAAAPSAGAAPPAAASPPDPTTTTTTHPPVPTTLGPPPVVTDDGGPTPTIIDSRLDPELVKVPADSPAYRTAIDAWRATRGRLDRATSELTDSTRQIGELNDAQARLTDTLNQAVRRHDKSQGNLNRLSVALKQLAVSDYIHGNTAALEDLHIDPNESTQRQGEQVLSRSVRRQQLAEVRANQTVVDQTTTIIEQSQSELEQVVARLGQQTDRRNRSQADQDRETVQLAKDAKGVADARLASPVQDQEYSLVALDAYVKAARVMAFVDPPCRIRWSLLAGIARTESRHGTYGGASLDGDGNETKPILGIALDGSPGTASVSDSDGGQYDGDPNTDRAVGPMQFIPSTWKRWGRDGNGDGVIDPQNMYDAALGAAAYLCYFGPGLDTDDGIRGAVIHYNNDSSYVELVLSRAKAYDTYDFGRPGSTTTTAVAPAPGASTSTAAPTTTTISPSAR